MVFYATGSIKKSNKVDLYRNSFSVIDTESDSVSMACHGLIRRVRCRMPRLSRIAFLAGVSSGLHHNMDLRKAFLATVPGGSSVSVIKCKSVTTNLVVVRWSILDFFEEFEIGPTAH